MRTCQQPAATFQDANCAAIFPALQEGEQLYQQGTAECLRQAITKCEEALTLRRAVGNRLGKATILSNIVAVHKA